jgi:hypothetical protein
MCHPEALRKVVLDLTDTGVALASQQRADNGTNIVGRPVPGDYG